MEILFGRFRRLIDKFGAEMFRFDHVHILCDDINAVGLFMRDVIGAAEIQTGEREQTWQYMLDGTAIFVRERLPDEALAPGSVRRAGLDHIGLAVIDMDAALERLLGAGCDLVTEPKKIREGLSVAFVQSPAGIVIELLERT